MNTELGDSRNDIVMWAICTAIGSQGELIDKMNRKIIDGKLVEDIKFNVNGVDLNFRNVMEDIEKNIDRMVEDKAKELIKDKFEGLHESLETMKKNILYESNKFKYEYE